MSGLDQLFEQFLRERTYVYNVTAKTCDWYQSAWHAFKQARSDTPSEITKADLLAFVVHLRERGVKPVSCNTWLRAMNAFCRWLHEQGEAATLVKLRPQRLEKRIIRTHDDAALRVLLGYRPKTFEHCRVHALVLAILDTGCRITELLTAGHADFDLDNLLLTVYGKGRKERRVPMSIDLRRVLFRWSQVKERAEITSPLMFPTRDGGRWHQRNALRSYYCLTKRLGLQRTGFHRLRHTFATQYLRNGGEVVRLSIILGHTQITTTQKYLHLLVEDLQAPHSKLSVLSRHR